MKAIANKIKSKSDFLKSPSCNRFSKIQQNIAVPSTFLGKKVIQRKAGCACGGNCPPCKEKEETFIQPKLKIIEPNDKYEQEAERVAERIMQMPEPTMQHRTAM